MIVAVFTSRREAQRLADAVDGEVVELEVKNQIQRPPKLAAGTNSGLLTGHTGTTSGQRTKGETHNGRSQKTFR
jgi:hypothetical protein